jgi:hypothetical protein
LNTIRLSSKVGLPVPSPPQIFIDLGRFLFNFLQTSTNSLNSFAVDSFGVK